jgi:hypothetical protein
VLRTWRDPTNLDSCESTTGSVVVTIRHDLSRRAAPGGRGRGPTCSRNSVDRGPETAHRELIGPYRSATRPPRRAHPRHRAHGRETCRCSRDPQQAPHQDRGRPRPPSGNHRRTRSTVRRRPPDPSHSAPAECRASHLASSSSRTRATLRTRREGGRQRAGRTGERRSADQGGRAGRRLRRQRRHHVRPRRSGVAGCRFRGPVRATCLGIRGGEVGALADGVDTRNRRRRGSYEPESWRSGQGQNRTADTTIFSRVLYQLSYLTVPRGSCHRLPRAASPLEAGASRRSTTTPGRRAGHRWRTCCLVRRADLTGFEPATSTLTGWRALQTAPQVLVVAPRVGRAGLEPATSGLKVRCSAS